MADLIRFVPSMSFLASRFEIPTGLLADCSIGENLGFKSNPNVMR